MSLVTTSADAANPILRGGGPSCYVRSNTPVLSQTILACAAAVRTKKKAYAALELLVRQPNSRQFPLLLFAAGVNAFAAFLVIRTSVWIVWNIVSFTAVAYWNGAFWVWAPLAAFSLFQRRYALLSVRFPVLTPHNVFSWIL